MRSTILLPTLLSPSSVRLGRLVLNTRSPHEDFIDPLDDDDRPSPKDTIVNIRKNFEETRKYSKSSKLRSYFTEFLSISYQSQSSGVSTISAPQVTVHELKNHPTWFQDACSLPGIRTWLEARIDDGKTVYLIVGFQSLRDARLLQSTSSRTSQGATAKIPVADLTGVRTPVAVTPKAQGDHETGHEQNSAYDAPGEQIFAVQYRKIKFQWLSSRTIDNIVLDETRWKAFWDSRGTDDDEEEEDVLEVSLADMSDYDISDDEYIVED